LYNKVFLGTSRQIKFGWRRLFPDFASQNQEKDASIQRIFRRRRRRKTFYTTPKMRRISKYYLARSANKRLIGTSVSGQNISPNQFLSEIILTIM